MGSVNFLLDESAFKMGFEKWISIDYEKNPHCLFAGRTGSGKTVAAKLLLARTVLLADKHLQPVEITVCDPKADSDFNFLNDTERFYRGEDAPEGLNSFFAGFRSRQNGEDTTRNLKILFVDEFASLVNLIDDKKEKEAAQKKLALLLMLSRSYKCSIQLATQQPSAQIFGAGGSGSREQFGAVCLLGDSGNETQGMLFDCDSKEKMKSFGSVGGRGVGWLSLNGGTAKPARVPKISDWGKLHQTIKLGVENIKENY